MEDNKEVFKETVYRLLLRTTNRIKSFYSQLTSSWKKSNLETPYIIVGDPRTTGTKFLIDKESCGVLDEWKRQCNIFDCISETTLQYKIKISRNKIPRPDVSELHSFRNGVLLPIFIDFHPLLLSFDTKL